MHSEHTSKSPNISFSHLNCFSTLFSTKYWTCNCIAQQKMICLNTSHVFLLLKMLRTERATWILLLSIIYIEEPRSFTALQDPGCPHGLCLGATCPVNSEVTGNVVDPALQRSNCNHCVSSLFSSLHPNNCKAPENHRNLSFVRVSAKIKGSTQRSWRTDSETHKRSATSTLPHLGAWPLARKGVFPDFSCSPAK